MAKGIKKTSGRPEGSIDKKSDYPRNEILAQIRCTEGFNKCVDELVSKGIYKSKSDVLHDALQQLAYKKLPGKFPWLNKIQ